MEIPKDLEALTTCASALDALYEYDSSLIPEVLQYLANRYTARLVRQRDNLEEQRKIKTAQIEAAQEISKADLLACLVCHTDGPHSINYELLKEKLAAQDASAIVM